MTKRLDVFQCKECGNTVEMLKVGGGALTCCNKPMTLLVENTVEASKEKHIPVMTREDKGLRVNVGSVAHPMEPKHFIEWIEIISEGMVVRRHLEPGDHPEAVFAITSRDTDISARAYCNLHGLWKL